MGDAVVVVSANAEEIDFWDCFLLFFVLFLLVFLYYRISLWSGRFALLKEREGIADSVCGVGILIEPSLTPEYLTVFISSSGSSLFCSL